MNGFHGWISSYNDGTSSRMLTSGGTTVITKSSPAPKYMSAGQCNCPSISHNMVYQTVPQTTHPIQFRANYIGGVNDCPPPNNYSC